VNALNRHIWVEVYSYVTNQGRREVDCPPKKESLLMQQLIIEVSTKPCCQRNCTQYFPRHKIESIRRQLHVNGGVYVHKLCLIEAHKQKRKNVVGKEWITLKKIDVCLTAWWTIHGISKATFYRFKCMANAEMEAKAHGNLGLKKPRKQTLQATAMLRNLIVGQANKMPYKSRTFESKEKVSTMVLPSAFR